MRKATVQATPIAQRKVAKAQTKLVKVCELEGCTQTLKARQTRFCSHTHKNLGIKGGLIDTNRSAYKAAYAGKLFLDYIRYCVEDDQPTLVPTDSSYVVLPKARIPSREGFANFLSIPPEGYTGAGEFVLVRTMDNWAIAHPEFAAVLDMLNQIQKEWLQNGGMRYGPVVTKLMLGVNHGMIEKKEVNQSHRFLGLVKHVYNRAEQLDEPPNGPA